MHKKGFYELLLKRPMDLVLSFLAFLMLSPILFFIAVLVRVKLGSPILFKQNRPGLNGKIFRMYKFRTMTEQKDIHGNLLDDSVRLTRFGKFLRATSLDELPELINILKGEMSLIGPRPLLENYLELYSEHQKRRHEVRPGLSGYAQVNGRNALSWEDKFNLDVYYVDNVKFLFDLKIILLTIKKVIIKEGINSNSSVTNEPFIGNEPVKEK